jgi:hypothetical protein
MWSHDARTGDPIGRVPVQDSQWNTGIGTGYDGTHTFVTSGSDGIRGSAVDAFFEPNDRILALWWGDQCAWAHKVEDWDYGLSSSSIVVKTVDLLTETQWRMVGQVDAPNSLTLTVTDRSAAGAIRALFTRMMQWSSDWAYPIDLPADSAGSVSGDWPFWKKRRIADIVDEILEQTGSEIYLRPYNAGAAGARQLRFQTLVASRIQVGLSSFNLQAKKQPLTDVHFKKSGALQVTGVLGVGGGTGTGEDQPTAWAGLMGDPAIIPIRDTKHNFPGLTGDALQEATNNYFEANRVPLTQWSIGGFTISDEWSPEDAAVARGWQIESNGDDVIPDATHNLRVLKLSGSLGRELKVEVQDV